MTDLYKPTEQLEINDGLRKLQRIQLETETLQQTVTRITMLKQNLIFPAQDTTWRVANTQQKLSDIIISIEKGVRNLTSVCE